MEDTEDGETRVGASLTTLIQEIYHLLEVILWKRARNYGNTVAHRFVKERDLTRILQKIDTFQEDPQLLDTHLETWIHQLWRAYLLSLPASASDVPKGHVRLAAAIAKVLYILCKVRGEKIIVGLLNNEPKYLEPLVSALEEATIVSNADSDVRDGYTWEERYVLFLWLSHLLLAPFDLASISRSNSKGVPSYSKVKLPLNLPSIPSRLVAIDLQYLGSATKEQSAAATQLVRMCLRPDMRQIGLLDSVAIHVMKQFDRVCEPFNLHQSLGNLNFLSQLVSSGNQQEIGHLLPRILEICQILNEDDKWLAVRSSAVARKSILKIMRNIALTGLQSEISGLDAGEVLESVIGFLLETLADGDTPVRMAASKSLSLITTRLDSDTSDDVLEAILGSMNEDVLWEGNIRNLVAVNPLRWHGLTLTLSHLLFRRALPPSKLSDVLNALLLALNFEQRSSTGSSIGTSVRDAANFGIWAIARRYTTSELAAVDVTNIRAADQDVRDLRVVQVLAIELVQTACLDPAGNVRRGASAALQELIGRHPNTIEAGIALVQVVDYHGVGLRRSAMFRATEAAVLHESYWTAVFRGLREWRGLCSSDAPSRISAAQSIARLSNAGNFNQSPQMLKVLIEETRALSSANVAERHGFINAIARLFEAGFAQASDNDTSAAESSLGRLRDMALEIMVNPSVVLLVDAQSYRLPMRRPELTAYATLQLLEAICVGLRSVGLHEQSLDVSLTPFMDLFDLCLRRTESNILELIPATVRALANFLPNLHAKVDQWLLVLETDIGTTSKLPGVIRALATAEPLVSLATNSSSVIIEALSRRCSPAIDINGRVEALKCLKEILCHPSEDHSRHIAATNRIADAVLIGLHDVTVNERGDVGSLVRIEALGITAYLWKLKDHLSEAQVETLFAAVVRLSLEKLDKVRMSAFLSLNSEYAPRSRMSSTLIDSPDFFKAALLMLSETSSIRLQAAILEGYCSTAGMGSEALMQTARRALAEFMAADSIHTSGKDVLFVTTWTGVLLQNLQNDRVALPLLESLAFLGDYNLLTEHRKTEPTIKYVICVNRKLMLMQL